MGPEWLNVWFVMLILAILFHILDVWMTWSLFYSKRQYRWDHVEEANKMFAWWFNEEGWVGNIGFIAALEFKITVTIIVYMLIVGVSEYFGLVLAIWFGASTVASIANAHTLDKNLKFEKARHPGREKILDNLRGLGLKDKPTDGELPIFINEFTEDAKCYDCPKTGCKAKI